MAYENTGIHWQRDHLLDCAEAHCTDYRRGLGFCLDLKYLCQGRDHGSGRAWDGGTADKYRGHNLGKVLRNSRISSVARINSLDCFAIPELRLAR